MKTEIEIPLATTFLDDKSIEVKIISSPSSTGLCKVMYNEKMLVRNKVQLTPTNEAGKKILNLDNKK